MERRVLFVTERTSSGVCLLYTILQTEVKSFLASLIFVFTTLILKLRLPKFLLIAVVALLPRFGTVGSGPGYF